jgi:Uma2 family endonuclease
MLTGMASRDDIAIMRSPEMMTADELLRLKLPNKRTELVRGRLVVREPAGFQHGVIAAAIAHHLREFVAAEGLGVVVAAETGFKLTATPDTVRAPDCGFVSKARIPEPMPRGYFPLSPDLAVEVLSPDDRPGEVLSKVADWLRAGSVVVWVINPERRSARVYRADGSESFVTEGEWLDGEQLLPGFVLPLSKILTPQ